ncbi:MAG: MFS transporter [Actinobacteria bacterium]|nr:MFS transporter [Actinomycetota bacterium]
MSSPDRGSAGQTSDHRLALAAGVLTLAVGLSVRFPITSVSPVLADIGAAYHLDATGLAALSAIPVLLFGLASPLAPLLVNRLGLERSITVLLATLALATLLRPVGTSLLYGGTLLVGASIALLGILAPQLIRRSLPHRGGFWTGMYTTSFGVSAAAGAAFSVPLLHAFSGRVGAALAAWSVPLLVAVGLALVFGRRLHRFTGGEHQAHEAAGSILRTHGIWAVTGFFGAQAMIYFSLTSWLPTIASDRGMPASQAGLLLAWMSLAGLPASLVAPTLAARRSLRIPLIVIVSALSIGGLLGLAYGPLALAPLMVAALGVAQSAAFGLAIALIVFTAPSAARTGSFSAVSQGFGYTAAAAGPLLLGLLTQSGLGWSTTVALLAIAGVGELVFGIAGARASLAAGR